VKFVTFSSGFVLKELFFSSSSALLLRLLASSSVAAVCSVSGLATGCPSHAQPRESPGHPHHSTTIVTLSNNNVDNTGQDAARVVQLPTSILLMVSLSQTVEINGSNREYTIKPILLWMLPN
jgi:hypothetical protein